MGIFNFFRKTAPTQLQHFIYRDAQGKITARTVEPQSTDDTYLHAFDHTEGRAIRTFRHDRVLETVKSAGELPERLKHHIATNPPAMPIKSTGRHNHINTNHLSSICFTGFAKADKAKLIELAESNNLHVAPAVIASLNYLCGGSRAGPSKMAKAKEQGVTILDQDQFMELIK